VLDPVTVICKQVASPGALVTASTAMPVFSLTATAVVPPLEHATSREVAKGIRKIERVRAELKESSLSSGATQKQFAMTVKRAIGAHRIFTRRSPARHKSVAAQRGSDATDDRARGTRR
jgi:hypothetical protein